MLTRQVQWGQVSTENSESATKRRSKTRRSDVRIAAIDVGSNSIRQIVADVSTTGGIRVVDEMKAAPRLGAGIQETGRLSSHSMAAALAALNRMSALAKQLGAKRRRVVATSAVREASKVNEAATYCSFGGDGTISATVFRRIEAIARSRRSR